MSSCKSLVLRLGEKCPEYAGNADFKDQLCAQQLPHKIPLYGTLVGLLNLENEEFVRKLVENTQSNLQDALETGSCNSIRILMRFLTVLMCSKVIQPSALVVVFESLLSSAATTVDEEKGIPPWQARADFYITCILSCLPWGGAELVEQVPEEIERVMVGVEAYLSIRKRVSDTGVSVFEDIVETNNTLNEMDFLEDLWSRVQDLSNRGWKLDSVPRPHLSFEAQLVAGKSHDLSPISCPEQPGPPGVLSGISFGRQKHEADLKYPQRIRRLNIFPSNKTEDIQPIDRFVVEEYLLDVLFFLNGCRKECASYMVGLPVPFRYEYLMAETIFSQSIENTPALEELLPPRAGPLFKYSAEDGTDPTEFALSVALKEMVKGRQTAREMISWVEESVFPAHGLDITLRVVVQTLLDIGSKSFTHLITVLERYGQVIAKICSDDDQQVKLITEVSSYWKNNAQMTAIAIDRMMSYRLISNLAIVRWVFSSVNLDRFHVSDNPWEILRNTVSKTYNRISDLRREISSLERSVVLAEEATARASEELDSSESKLSLMDGEHVLGENPVRMKRLKAFAEKAKEKELSIRESLEAKEALLARAVDEIEALFLSLYKSFWTALAEPLHDAFRDGSLRPSGPADMAIDLENSSAMEFDKDDERPKKSHLNGSRERNGYNLDEKQQWCLSTLGYLKAFTRPYVSEVWKHIEKLDAEVLTEDVHPLFRKAIYCGLRRPFDE